MPRTTRQQTSPEEPGRVAQPTEDQQAAPEAAAAPAAATPLSRDQHRQNERLRRRLYDKYH